MGTDAPGEDKTPDESPSVEALQSRIEALERRVDELEGGPTDTPGPEQESIGRWAPNETTDAVIRSVLATCRERDRDRVVLDDFYAAIEREGYTRTQDLKRYARLAVRHGPFKNNPDVTSGWFIDTESTTDRAEPAEATP